MARFPIVWLVALALVTLGCDSDRINRLEKQNQELQEQLKQVQTGSALELQAKCAKDAREFFQREFPADPTTLLLTQTNHYNRSLNKCFVLIEHHYKQGGSPTSSWFNHIFLFDVYENVQYGIFSEFHQIRTLDFKDEPHLYQCEAGQSKCKSGDEFSTQVSSFMQN